MDTEKKTTKKPQLDQTETIDSLPLACASEDAARLFIEQERWGNTPCCPHCGDTNVYRMTGAAATKRGLWRCHGCKKQYTVRVGSIFEDSKFPLTLWCRALWEATSCKNGVSALELSRKLQITYKSALFMMHRIRHAMADSPFNPPTKLSGEVEIDETFVGGKPRYKSTRGLSKHQNKAGRGAPRIPVMAVVQRDGEVRANIVAGVTADNIKAMLEQHVEPGSCIYSDEFLSYRRVCREHGQHRRVNHGMGEYVNRIDPTLHTNTIENFFSRLKRGLNGTYHAVSPEHLHRYVNQFGFMYNTRGMNDGQRVCELIRRTNGKRLVYKPTKGKAA